jgi:hypothetical protein
VEVISSSIVFHQVDSISRSRKSVKTRQVSS